MKAAMLFLPCLAAVAACAPATQQDITERSARSVVTRVILDSYPDREVEPLLDCIIANASSYELRGLASDTLTGADQATYLTVETILGRDTTRTCLLNGPR